MAIPSIKTIFAPQNRGILFDLLIFLLNIVFFGVLSSNLRQLIEEAKTDDLYAKLVMVLYLYGLCILPGLSAVLKFVSQRRQTTADYDVLWDGMFKKVLVLILIGQVLANLIFMLVGAGLHRELLELSPNPSLLSYLLQLLFWAALFLAITAPIFIYLYFSTSQLKFLAKFAKIAKLEILGGFSIFVNLILYQAFWGILAADLTKDFQDIPGRISTLAFTVVVIYLPPRIFFLAEDAHRPLAWLTILLANLPLILRVAFF